jgi:phenylalanyl-tRNA synthetase beta chain
LFGEDAARRIVMPNPISSDQSILRTSLIPQMVDTLGRNRARQIQAAALFELGRVFTKGESEETRLCVGAMGPVGRAGLDSRRPVDAEESYLWIKGVWEQLSAARRFSGWSLRETSLSSCERACEIVQDGKVIGRLGLIRAGVRKEWRLNDPIAVLEVDVAPLLKNSGHSIQFAAIPAFPSVERDVALVADEALAHAEIEKTMRAAAPKELESIRLFDIFRGASIGPGRKSLAYALTYRSAARTLTDEETNGYHDRVKDALRRQLHVEIRET